MDTNATQSESTLCTPLEVSIVSCQVAAKKLTLLSLCASSSDFGSSFDSIRYVFGTKEKSQLTKTFIEPKTIPRGIDSGTFTTYFSIKNNEYSYIIGVPEERLGAKTFVSIFNDGKIIQHLECNNNSMGMKKLPSPIFFDVSGFELSQGRIAPK